MPRTAATGSAGPVDVYELALRLLARRDFSIAQLRQRLRDDSDDVEQIDAAIDRLTRDGALDDRRVATAYARTAAGAKGRGRLRVLRELSAMGIANDTARAAVEDAFAAEDAAALLERAVARHVRAPLRDQRAYQRAYRALARLGFASGEVHAALKRHARDADLGGLAADEGDE